ncbi:hypothetical protein KEM56_003461 [Ascosphaera pollenicola]|nr:hypothetical protein KEM56_003461 [Ascosphaera pollenicola]
MDHISLSIPKFSYATSTSPSSSSASWTHITSAGHSDLKVDFYIQGTGGFSQKTRTLRISRNKELLENLDLTWLAQNVVHSVAAMGPSNRGARSPIAVIVKSPCLAVRYQTNQQQIRRFQIKFGSNDDYMRAVSILSDAGCPVTESSMIQSQLQQDNLHTQSQSHVFQHSQHCYAPAPADPFAIQQQSQSPAVASSGLTMNTLALPKPRVQGYQNLSPASSVCSPIKPSYQPGGLSLSGIESTTTTPSWQSTIDSSQRPVTHGGHYQSGNASDASTLPTPGRLPHNDGIQDLPCQYVMGRPSTAPLPDGNCSAMPPPPLPSATARGSSYPAMHAIDNDDLPPRRELPFLKPSKEVQDTSFTVGPNKENVNPIPAWKATVMPTIGPLGKGKKSLGVKPNYTPTSQKTLSDKPFKSPLKRKLIQAEGNPTTTSLTVTPVATTGSIASVGSARCGNDNGSGNVDGGDLESGVKGSGVVLRHSINQPAAAPSLGSNTVTPSQISRRNSISSNMAPSATSTPMLPPTVTAGRQAQKVQAVEGAISGIAGQHNNAGNATSFPSIASSTTSSDLWTAATTMASAATGVAPSFTNLTANLSAYVAMPTPERMAALESWVCAQLEDEGFLKLCEDVEGVWRRIEYGF